MTKSTKWTDTIAIIASIAMIGLSVWLSWRNGAFAIPLASDEKLAWHLVRSSGVVAYVLLLASTIWGLFLSSQVVKDWSPGVLSMTIHTTISWLALLLGLVHALLLMFDDYLSYTLGDILIPFTGPYRPEAVGLGTLAFWLMLIIALSFPLKKRIGHQTWKRLHYTSYIAFGMVSAHGIFAGTDSALLGFRLLMGFGVGLVILLLGIRMGHDQIKNSRQPSRKKTT